MTGQPLVSVIVRARGPAALRRTLASLAVQDHPRIEVLVIEAGASADQPLPALPLRPGHSVRRLPGGPWTRPAAANAALDAATGDFVAFLDGDQTIESTHLGNLVREAGAHPKSALVYGRARVAGGDAERWIGRRWNWSTALQVPVALLGAALIRRPLLGATRFDEAFEAQDCADFVLQLAQRSAPVQVEGSRLHAGAAEGAEPWPVPATDARRPPEYFRALLEAKWAGPCRYHARRAALRVRDAMQVFERGDLAAARAALEAVLEAYPDEPRALHGLARIDLKQGDVPGAARRVETACEHGAASPGLHLTAATVFERLGDAPRARRHAAQAADDPRYAEVARSLLDRLPAEPAPPAAAPDAATGAISLTVSAPSSPFAASGAGLALAPDRIPHDTPRNAPCPCGSGRRFKECHGAAGGGTDLAPPRPAGVAAELESARADRQSGYLSGALARADRLQPHELSSAAECGEVSLWYQQAARWDRALAFAARAAAIDPAAGTGILAAACGRATELVRDRSIAAQIRRVLDAWPAGAPAQSDSDTVHVVASLETRGGNENHALELYRQLSRHRATRIWSPTMPHPEIASQVPGRTIDLASGAFPAEGVLVLVGHMFPVGDWLGRVRPRRIVLNVCSVPIEAALNRVVEIEHHAPGCPLELTFPSASFRDHFGLPGGVETPLVPIERFERTRPRPAEGISPLVIGRHSRDVPDKFHPDDPALFRALMRRGHSVRLMGAALSLAPAFRNERWPRLGLLPFAAMPAAEFLQGLDVFIYRRPDTAFEASGTVVLEAMALGLAVVVFGRMVGGRDWIDHGENGFLVETMDEAVATIDRLARDPALRTRVGAAAAGRAAAIVRDARSEVLRRYLGIEMRREASVE